MTKISNKTAFYLILLLALALRIWQFFVTDNFYWGGDSYSRMQYAYEMLLNFKWFPHLDWLPLHFHFLYLQFLISDNTIDFPRIVNILVAVLAIHPLYKIGNLWSGQKRVGLIGGLLYAIGYPFVFYSTLTLADTLNMTLCLYGIFFFMDYLQKEKHPSSALFFSALFFGLGNWTKYESWLIAFFCGVYLIATRSKIRDVLMYGLITSLPILTIFNYQYQASGDFLRGINFSNYEVKGIYKLWPKSRFQRLKEIYFAFPFYNLIFALPFSFMHVWKKNRFLPLLLITIVCFSFYKLFIASTLLAAARYFLIPSALLMVFLAQLLLYFWQAPLIHQYIKGLVIFIGLLTSTWFSHQTVNYVLAETGPRYRPGYIDTALWYKKADLPEKSKIFLDKDQYYTHYAWGVYAGLKDFPTKGCEYRDRPWDNDKSNRDLIFECLKNRDIKYLLLFENSQLLLELDNRSDLSKMMDLELLHQAHEFKIFEIKRIHPPWLTNSQGQ